MMYSLDEVGLIPATISDIKHRGDVNPYVLSPFGGEKLPIFVAPMTCLLNANNICTFGQSKVEPILPVCSGGLELRRQLPNGSMWNKSLIIYLSKTILQKNHPITFLQMQLMGI